MSSSIKVNLFIFQCHFNILQFINKVQASLSNKHSAGKLSGPSWFQPKENLYRKNPYVRTFCFKNLLAKKNTFLIPKNIRTCLAMQDQAGSYVWVTA